MYSSIAQQQGCNPCRTELMQPVTHPATCDSVDKGTLIIMTSWEWWLSSPAHALYWL